MKIDAEQLTRRLEAALGAAAVATDRPTVEGHAVDGMLPHVVCHPADAGQVAAVVRICAEADAALAPWGGGTAVGLGNVPRRVDVVLRTDRLAALGEHDAANLTATVQAGMPLGVLQEHLRRHGQFLPLDPPYPDRATIGGVIATNLNGPRRMLYGGVRDLLIGAKMVLATGEQVRAGGKVVKNVAGYDLCKLFVGSLGTLGIITEATFKMAPVPERAATLVARGGTEQALRMAEELGGSMLQPAAVTLLSPATAAAAGLGPSGVLAIAVEGFSEVVDRQLTEIAGMAAAGGLSSDVLQGAAHDGVWAAIRDFPWPADREAAFRIVVPPALIAEALQQIFSRAGAPNDLSYIAHAGTGTIWMRGGVGGHLTDFPDLLALARRLGGHAVMAAAQGDGKRGVDVWGAPPAALSIMREIKHQFDPQALLNPGRFVAFL